MKKFKLILTGTVLCGLVCMSNPALAQSGTASDNNRSAMTDDHDNNDHNHGNWGWLGLIGLAGLAGLRKKDNARPYSTTNTGTGTSGRTGV